MWRVAISRLVTSFRILSLNNELTPCSIDLMNSFISGTFIISFKVYTLLFEFDVIYKWAIGIILLAVPSKLVSKKYW